MTKEPLDAISEILKDTRFIHENREGPVARDVVRVCCYVDALRREVEELKEFQSEDKAIIANLQSDRDRLQSQLAARDLVWSKEVPTVFPAWYWVKFQNTGCVIAEFLECAEEAEVCHNSLFAGPIPEPK